MSVVGKARSGTYLGTFRTFCEVEIRLSRCGKNDHATAAFHKYGRGT